MSMTSRELRLMQEVQEDTAMPDTVTIKRAAKTDDGFGGSHNEVLTVVAENVPARVSQGQTLDLGGQAARVVEVEKWTVRLPYGTDVQEFDLVVWSGGTIRVDELKSRSWQTVISIAGEKVK